MATPTEKFRSALNGFNRTDVVQFIQRQTAEHEKALRQAKEENTRATRSSAELREQVAELNAQIDALTAEKAALAEENERLLAEQKRLQTELSQRASVVVAEAPTESELERPFTPVSVPSEFNEMELAAYRRAEQAERLSRERAAASAERMRNIFKQADDKLALTTADLGAVLETCRGDFAQLEEILCAAKEVLGESSDSLKAASELCEI